MDQEAIDQATELLHAAVAAVVLIVGKDVARSLLIHFLHEVDTDQIAPSEAA